jgi:DNA-binding CsgD family transcriptional regulator
MNDLWTARAALIERPAQLECGAVRTSFNDSDPVLSASFGPRAEWIQFSIVSPEFARMLFDLTAAESRLVCALAEGRNLGEIAAEAGNSIHTVRTQLKSALAKTGTARQAELVALLLKSAATLGPP